MPRRNPNLITTEVDDVILGCVTPVGDQGADIARTAVLASDFGEQVGGVSLNRFCASGLEAVNLAAQKVRSGWDELVVAGGVESMTRAPWVLPKPSRAYPAANVTAVSTTLGWRLVNERIPAEWTVSLGEANEQLADRFVDSYAAIDPTIATYLGVPGYDDAWPDLSPAGLAARALDGSDEEVGSSANIQTEALVALLTDALERELG